MSEDYENIKPVQKLSQETINRLRVFNDFIFVLVDENGEESEVWMEQVLDNVETAWNIAKFNEEWYTREHDTRHKLEDMLTLLKADDKEHGPVSAKLLKKIRKRWPLP